MEYDYGALFCVFLWDVVAPQISPMGAEEPSGGILFIGRNQSPQIFEKPFKNLRNRKNPSHTQPDSAKIGAICWQFFCRVD
jgi:hypothetical protein